MIVLVCTVVMALVFIAPFFIEPGDRAMREKEHRDCRDALDQPYDGEMEPGKEHRKR